MERNNSKISKLLQILDTFGGPDRSLLCNLNDEFGIITKKDVLTCARCIKKIDKDDCPYCQERGYLTTNVKTAVESTLNGKNLGKVFGEVLVKEKLVEKIDSIEVSDVGLYLLLSSSKLKNGIVIFRSSPIGEETFRQITSVMNQEKNCDCIIFLCKKYDDNISKLLNLYPMVRICTFEEAKNRASLFKEYYNAFHMLEKLNPKLLPSLFSENDDITAAINRSKEIIAKVERDGLSNTTLGNDFEDQMKKILGYIFTALEIPSRNNLPELVIFDYSSGFYLVDVKSGQYSISEYRKVKSYAESYYKLTNENNKILKIRGIIIPNILWKSKAISITEAFSEFVKNYVPFNNTQVSITLIDADAVIALAEKKPIMTNNCYTYLLLNVETIFRNGCVTLEDVNRLVEEMQNKTDSKEDAISKSLEQSRGKYVP